MFYTRNDNPPYEYSRLSLSYFFKAARSRNCVALLSEISSADCRNGNDCRRFLICCNNINVMNINICTWYFVELNALMSFKPRSFLGYINLNNYAARLLMKISFVSRVNQSRYLLQRLSSSIKASSLSPSTHLHKWLCGTLTSCIYFETLNYVGTNKMYKYEFYVRSIHL